jgi:hypothetical protein
MIDTITPAALTAATVAAAGTQASNFTEVDLAAKAVGSNTWSAIVLHIKAVNGAAAAPQGESLTVFYAPSVFTGIGAGNVSQLRATARSFVVPLSGAANDTTITVSPVIASIGTALYLWFAHDDWSQLRTVTVTAAGL